jgi:hypothetical protein
MKKLSLSGLVVTLRKGKSFHLVRRDGLAVVIEVTLIAAVPESQSATLAINASGEKVDMKAIGLPTTTVTLDISSLWTTEIVPGVRVAIRNGNRFRSPRMASLVIDAPRHLWGIQRDELLERELLVQARSSLTGGEA